MSTHRSSALRRAAAPLGVGAVAVAVLLAVLFAVDGPGSALGGVQPQETPTATPTTDATEAPATEIEARVTSYEVFLARDPFDPVVPEPQAGGGGGTGGNGTGTPPLPPTTPTTPTSPTTGPSPSPTDPSTPPSGCVTNGTVTCDGKTVSLVDVYEQDGTPRASVMVDQVLYDVGSGDTFADNFRVLSIEAPCVTLQFGDDRFSLCEGESVLK